MSSGEKILRFLKENIDPPEIRDWVVFVIAVAILFSLPHILWRMV